MSAAERFTLSKEERICSKKLINELFTGNGRSMTAFPLRVVFMKRTIVDDQPRAAMLVSVPKRYFKHVVARTAPGMASQYATHGEPESAYGPVLDDGLSRIFRACGGKSA